MTHVIAVALGDAEAGFLRYHARPGFWAACAVIVLVGLLMAHEARS